MRTTLLLAVLAISNVSSAAVVTWTNTNGGLWSGAANWSGGAVPTVGDDVFITTAGTYSVTQDVHTTVASLMVGGSSGQQTLTNSGMTLAMTGSSAVNSNGVLAVTGVTIGGVGPLTVAGRMRTDNCNLGGFRAGSMMVVAPGGRLEMVGSGNHVLWAALTNHGTIEFSGGTLYVQDYTVLFNDTDALLDIQGDRTITANYNVGSMVNHGVIRKSGGGGVADIQVPLNNSATLDAEAGQIQFTGALTLNDGSSLTGDGTNSVVGNLTLNGTISSENLILSSGGVSGSGTLIGTAQWQGSQLGSIGSLALVIATNATLQLSGGANHVLWGALTNRGRVEFSSGTLYVQGGGILLNAAGGLLDIQGDRTITANFGVGYLANLGNLRKSAGSGTALIEIRVANSGTLDAQVGQIQYTGTVTADNGTQFIGAGTNLLAAGATTLNGAIYSQNLHFGGAVLLGTNSLSGVVRWTAGNIDPQGALTVATNGILQITGPGIKGINGVLINRGLIQLSDVGTLAMGSQSVTATIDNRAGGIFEALSDAAIAYTAFNPPAFINAGIVRKSGGTGMTLFDNVLFSNTGALDAQTGTIAFNRTGCLFDGGTQFIGAGTNLLAAGATTLNGAIYSQNLHFGGAVLLGTNSLSGTVRWTAGNIDPQGALTVATNGVLQITGPGIKGINGVLVNRGLIQLSDVGTLAMGTVNVTATIDNQAGGIFDVLSDAAVAYTAYNQPVFINAGILRKSGGTGPTSVSGVPFLNSGTVDVQSGTIAFLGGYTQTGGTMRFGLNGLTNFGRVQISGNAPLTGTLAVNLNGGYVPATGNSFALVTYGSQTGAFTGFDLAPQVAWQTNSSIYGPNAVTLTVLNVRPTLGPIGDQTTDEQVLLGFSIVGSDPDAGQSLSYSLLDPPAGATINSASGLFSWTPGETQGPSTNQIVAIVTDNGSPALSATNTFVVVVNEVNLAPVLAAIPDLTAIQDVPLRYTNSVTDADVPANSFSFDLIAPPSGMTVDASGVIHWTPSGSQVPGTNAVTARVTDNGVPAGTDTKTFTVVAFPLPRLAISKAGTNVVLSWPAYAVNFTLQSATNLTRPTTWTDVTNAVAIESDRNVITNSMGAKERFYRLRYR